MKNSKQRVPARTPAQILEYGEYLLAQYSYIMLYGASSDIPDGEELLKISARIFAVKAEMETSSFAHEKKIKEFWTMPEPPIVRPWYMAREKEIILKAENLLRKFELESNLILQEIQKEADLFGLTLSFQMERILTAYQVARTLFGVSDKTPDELMLLARSLVVLRNFNQKERTGRSLAAQYVQQRKRQSIRIPQYEQLAM